MKPTIEQIQNEIEQLKELKPKIRHYSAFGDDNRASVQAQIDVLERGMDEDGIYNRWDEGERDMNIRDAALGALQWMTNGETDDGETGLAEGWKGLVQE